MMAEVSQNATQPSVPTTTRVLPPPTPHHAPRFSLDTEQSVADAMEFLEREGYAVIADVVGAEARSHAMDLLWKWIEGAGTDVKRADWTTWGNDRWPGHHEHAVIAQHGIGHSDFLWFLRTQPNVRRVYEAIWGHNELLTSFDGCGIFRPYTQQPEWRTTGGWYHVDQGRTKIGKHCVQGFVSLTPATATTGGLVVIPRTQHLHERLTGGVATAADFVRVNHDTEYVPFDKAIVVCCNAGDMVVWDGRTIHCSTPAVVQEAHSMDELLRVVAYICMTPRHLTRDENLIRDREEAYECFTTTNHWPHEFTQSAKPVHEKPVRKLNDAAIAVQELVRGIRLAA